MPRRLGLFALVIVCGCAEEPGHTFSSSDAQPQQAGQESESTIRILQANVGNMDWQCRAHDWHLCRADVEQRIASNIQRLSPDIIFVQEILQYQQCQTEKPADVCELGIGDQRNQIRRLVGDDVTIVCSPYGASCIAWKQEFATAADDDQGNSCADGYLCGDTELHFFGRAGRSPRRFSVYEPVSQGNGFVVFYIDLLRNTEVLRLLSGHLISDWWGSSEERALRLQTLFDWAEQAHPATDMLFAGDINFDPETAKPSDPDAAVWHNYVGSDRLLGSVHSTDEPTLSNVLGKFRVDHVASNFAEGSCQVLDEPWGNQWARLDANAIVPEGYGMDHYALLCDLLHRSP
jgi:endonuclease/exonuclease/phosphatase family metal-dependent hydrolase